MKKVELEKLQEVIDVAGDNCTEVLKGDALRSLKEAMRKIASEIGSFRLSLDVEFRVWDNDRENSMRLLSMGMAVDPDGSEPRLTTGDCSYERYVVDGEICEVPHDYCPHCWEIWDFKIMSRKCQECGYALGDQVKLLIDNDVCPHCENGKVTMQDPSCTNCDFVADQDVVSWG